MAVLMTRSWLDLVSGPAWLFASRISNLTRTISSFSISCFVATDSAETVREEDLTTSGEGADGSGSEGIRFFNNGS